MQGYQLFPSAGHILPAAQRHASTVHIKYDSLPAISSSMLLFSRPSTFPSPPGHRRFTELHHFISPSVSAEPPPPNTTSVWTPWGDVSMLTLRAGRPSITKISPAESERQLSHIICCNTRYHYCIPKASTDGNYILFSLFHN